VSDAKIIRGAVVLPAALQFPVGLAQSSQFQPADVQKFDFPVYVVFHFHPAAYGFQGATGRGHRHFIQRQAGFVFQAGFDGGDHFGYPGYVMYLAVVHGASLVFDKFLGDYFEIFTFHTPDKTDNGPCADIQGKYDIVCTLWNMHNNFLSVKAVFRIRACHYLSG